VPPPYPHIAITARRDFPNKEEVLGKVLRIAEQSGAKVCVDAEHCDVPSLQTCDRFKELEGFDLIIAVGGDGTIIATVREMQNFDVPVLGIHSGTLGFLSTIDVTEMEEELPKLLKGEGVIDERQLLDVCIEENGKRTTIGRVLNEAVVSQGGISRLMELQTTINGEELTTYRADGLIMATPTGSTAYSLAAGGAIVHPQVAEHMMIVIPINPHSFSHKPLIIPGNDDIAVRVITKDNAYRTIDPVLTLDGQRTFPLKRGQKIHACSFEKHVKFLRKKDDSFYKRIREKLKWGEVFEE